MKLIDEINKFRDQLNERNKWLHGDEGSVYVRQGVNVFAESITPTFDLASIHMTQQGQGHFTKLLGEIEQSVTNTPIRVENIQTDKFREFFNKRGYTITGQMGCWCAWRFHK